jgi:hypothetical protein
MLMNCVWYTLTEEWYWLLFKISLICTPGIYISQFQTISSDALKTYHLNTLYTHWKWFKKTFYPFANHTKLKTLLNNLIEVWQTIPLLSFNCTHEWTETMKSKIGSDMSPYCLVTGYKMMKCWNWEMYMPGVEIWYLGSTKNYIIIIKWFVFRDDARKLVNLDGPYQFCVFVPLWNSRWPPTEFLLLSHFSKRRSETETLI